MNLLIRIVIAAILLVLILTTVQNHTDDVRYEVLLDDYEALQKAYDELYEEHEVMKYGYRDLQQEHSQKTEQIEHLEYRIISDDEISEKLKQEIKENVPGEGER
ncbi:type II secretion system protein [Jeotgalicoccus marinus]|uniref:type II secretion system protein n=1 Tax=Jeotgalicoccus marinus TaxID=516700 RepID=UPI00047D7BC8|nr:hypothetical protein [Jeotgalicoccus marinus]